MLKQQEKPIRSINLQKKIEKKTGRQISNMTVFMDQLMKKNPEIRKPHRGRYIVVRT
ncbi:Rok-like winged helix domain-containing protein [Bacillus glycinifermentans]|uniref:Rok-like winged helix domain-containing protein n=1 Tax=Bacillus glycinifermentans TaxID=1664069 RepID=UPI003F4DB3C6